MTLPHPQVLPPPAKERRTEPDTGRFVLEYAAKAQSLLEAPVTPESDSEAWDPTHDPEHVGTSMPDPTNVPGVHTVCRDSMPSPEGEARLTFSTREWREYAEKYETAHLQREREVEFRN